MAGPRRQRSALRSALHPILLLLGSAGVLAGADGFVLPTDPPPLVNTPGVLVLKSGRAISGRISQNASGFVVEQPHGSIVVPFDFADFPASDLEDAVRQYHKRTPNPTAGFHVNLAQWCLQHQLLDEARTELHAALVLEPHRQDARHMLRRLDALLDPPEAPAAERAPIRQVAGFDVPEVTSLAGLDPEHARVFTERVQPILMNKCGNASCHGPAAENEFRLTRVRLTGGAHRVHSERNLAVTLRYVDQRSPDRSPLLVVPQGNHGRAGRTIFNGPFAQEQFQTLREWVRGVAAAKGGSAPPSQHPSLAAGDGPSADPLSGTPDPYAIPASPSSASRTYPAEPAPVPAEPADAFDPEAFNRAAASSSEPPAVGTSFPGVRR